MKRLPLHFFVVGVSKIVVDALQSLRLRQKRLSPNYEGRTTLNTIIIGYFSTCVCDRTGRPMTYVYCVLPTNIMRLRPFKSVDFIFNNK